MTKDFPVGASEIGFALDNAESLVPKDVFSSGYFCWYSIKSKPHDFQEANNFSQQAFNMVSKTKSF